MGQQKWDFALKIRGVTPSTVPMGQLAEYLREFAGLLGDDAKPVFVGMVKGSVVLRARETGTLPPAIVRTRMRTARHSREAPGGKSYARLRELLAKDRATGTVLDCSGETIVEIAAQPEPQSNAMEHVISDRGEIDGVIVGIQGIDETVHVRVQGQDGAVASVELRDISRARAIAQHFRGDPVRLRVRGTWKRSADGAWAPEHLHFEGLEELDPRTAREILDELSSISGNGWDTVDDLDKAIDELRSEG